MKASALAVRVFKAGAAALLVFFVLHLLFFFAAVVWNDSMFDFSVSLFEYDLYRFAVMEDGFEWSGTFLALAIIFGTGMFMGWVSQKRKNSG